MSSKAVDKRLEFARELADAGLTYEQALNMWTLLLTPLISNEDDTRMLSIEHYIRMRFPERKHDADALANRRHLETRLKGWR